MLVASILPSQANIQGNNYHSLDEEMMKYISITGCWAIIISSLRISMYNLQVGIFWCCVGNANSINQGGWYAVIDR
jgi:hypothetical protein